MKKEIIINLILTILISFIGFFQNKYFIQYIGIEILGIMKLFSQFLQYLNIIEMGIGNASTFALYKPLAEKNYKQVSIILSTIKSFYNKIALMLFLLGILATPTLPFFMKLESFNNMIYIYWILYLLNTISTYLYIKYVILFTANQEFILVRYIQSFSKIIFQIFQIILIVKIKSFLLYILILLLDNLIQYIFFKMHYNRNYSYIYKTKEKYQGLNRDVKNLFWHKLAGLIVFNTDLILISKFVSIEIVGIYASYQLILQMISMLVNVIISVIRPKLGRFISLNLNEKIYELFRKINILFLYLGILFSYCTYTLINDFIGVWIGSKYILDKFTVFLIGINLFIGTVRVILENFKEASGFFDDIQSPILEAIINFIFSVILGIKYGLNGIIMGTIISNVTVILIYKPILVFKRCFDENIKEYIKVYGNYLILLVISLFCLNTVTKPFIKENINSWIDWIIYATTISIITGVVLFIVFLLNKEFRNIIKVYILKKK